MGRRIQQPINRVSGNNVKNRWNCGSWHRCPEKACTMRSVTTVGQQWTNNDSTVVSDTLLTGRNLRYFIECLIQDNFVPSPPPIRMPVTTLYQHRAQHPRNARHCQRGCQRRPSPSACPSHAAVHSLTRCVPRSLRASYRHAGYAGPPVSSRRSHSSTQRWVERHCIDRWRHMHDNKPTSQSAACR